MRFELYLEGQLTGFYKYLYDSIITADNNNIEKLRLSFPVEVNEVEQYRA